MHSTARELRRPFVRQPDDPRRHRVPGRRMLDRGRFRHLPGWWHVRAAGTLRGPGPADLGLTTRPGSPPSAPGGVDSRTATSPGPLPEAALPAGAPPPTPARPRAPDDPWSNQV